VELKSGTAGVTAKINGYDFGSPGKRLVPAGQWAMKVEAPGFLADDIDLKVEAQKSQVIESNLVVKPAEPPPNNNAIHQPPAVVEKPAPSGKPLWSRPGLYVAAGGVALAAVGVAIGSSAKGVEARMVDANGDRVLDVTRREVKAAQGNAALANILVGVGVAAIAGG